MRVSSMQQDYWESRWAEGRTGWHKGAPHPVLQQHFAQLACEAGDPVLVPLCGKSVDLGWIADEAKCVAIGVEWARDAVRELFEERAGAVAPERLDEGVELWESRGLSVLCADWFRVNASMLAQAAGQEVRAWWDRASLIALPPEIRPAYVAHLAGLLPSGSRGLLLSLEYPPGEKQGPPFSVDQDEVQRLFGAAFEIEEIDEIDALASENRRQDEGMTRLVERVYGLVRR